MYSPKRKLSCEEQLNNDKQGNISSNVNNSYSDVDSPAPSYALIEADSNELEQIIDLLRQFFPKTKIHDYNHSLQTTKLREQQQQVQTSITKNFASQFLIPSFDSDSNNEQVSSNSNSQIFKGKVKNYLQRRYLQQTGENQSDKEFFTKSPSDYSHSLNLSSSSSSSTINKPSKTFKSHSFDSSSVLPKDQIKIERSPSKRGLLQHYTTIDLDDTSNDAQKIKFSIDQPDDDDNEEEIEDEEDEGKSSSHSSTNKQTDNKKNHFLLPYHHSFEYEQNLKTSPYPSGMQLPLTPYSISSDPGPYHSPWFNTPTSPMNFRFPQTQEQLHVNAQGTIAQLSSLTKMLCDEPSVFTPISPRFKTEKCYSHTSRDSSVVPPCQICRQEFNSHQMYLTHYRTHLEGSSENNQSDIFDSDINCDRSSDLRNYVCKICSKRFSRSDMLNRHLRSHSGIRPYRCTMCNTYFSRSDHLSTHLRTHTGEKPYTCPQCSYTACRRDMITRHLKIHMKQQRSERKNATSSFALSNEF
ncbi:unnamed protein product [Adineta steineri]|uniref:C2H2-type domain-containing protein n=1 Tax=Adineta steineri TaxID=433720 RepID=A0A815DU19_9BILA|nr:unnamed protein product [Adineta steineri]CAF1305809.1 unnamed protein product [Adineta steineri]